MTMLGVTVGARKVAATAAGFRLQRSGDLSALRPTRDRAFSLPARSQKSQGISRGSFF
jgi:hypothetical protein